MQSTLEITHTSPPNCTRRREEAEPCRNPSSEPFVEPSTADAPAWDTDPGPARYRIARLPKAFRDQINSMLDDSLSPAEIASRLLQATDPPLPYPISEHNIKHWRSSGYQRYLAQQERLSALQSDRDSALDIVAGGDTTAFPEATLQIIASQYYKFMQDFSPEALKDKIAEDPLKFTRFLNVFARLVREILHLRKYRDAANAAAVELKQCDPSRDLVANELLMLVNNMDKTFKMPRPDLAQLLAAAERSRAALAPQTHRSSRREEAPEISSESLSPTLSPTLSESSSASASPVPHPPRLVPPKLPGEGGSTAEAGQPINQSANPQIQQSINAPPPTNSTHPSTEHCPRCRALLLPRLPNGLRPSLNCDHCSESLPTQPTVGQQPVEHCPHCFATLPPLLPSGERPSMECRACQRALPPPGQAVEQKADHCFECGARLPALLPDGRRPSPSCPHCAAPLPPPPPESAWISEYCAACGSFLAQPTRSRHRERLGCIICGHPLPDLPRRSLQAEAGLPRQLVAPEPREGGSAAAAGPSNH